MDLKNKRVLLSQHRLVDFTGSEIITLEMAEYFTSRGAEVIIVTNNLDQPIKEYFDKISGLKIYSDFLDEELDKTIREYPPDIAWIHHQIIIPALFSDKALSTTRYIFNHMSSYYFQEFPLAHNIEQQLADLVFYNSLETKKAFDEAGLLMNVANRRKLVINNPTPSSYHTEKLRNNRNLEKILVVTNHLPDDLSEAIKILEQDDVYVEVAGVSNKEAYRRITAEIIQKFDVVVSIGKTVQYALCGGVPVYCYDKFGGPGYLSRDNFKKALEYNFSGRGFDKKTPIGIASELKHSLPAALVEAAKLQKLHAREFNIDNVIDNALKNIGSLPSQKTINKTDAVLYGYYFEMLDRLFKMEKVLNNNSGAIAELNAKVTGLENDNTTLKNEIDSIINSSSYKLIRRIKGIKSTFWR